MEKTEKEKKHGVGVLNSMTWMVILIFCTAWSCNRGASDNQGTPELLQHWVHSFEEDEVEKQIETYRPQSFSFPPARGRDGFEIKGNGIFIAHPIAAQDGNQTLYEKWDIKKNELIITGTNHVSKFKIIELTKDKLTLKRIN